jgi:hypothetical protein
LFEREFASVAALDRFVRQLHDELGASEHARTVSELEQLVVAIDEGKAHHVSR